MENADIYRFANRMFNIHTSFSLIEFILGAALYAEFDYRHSHALSEHPITPDLFEIYLPFCFPCSLGTTAFSIVIWQ